VARTQINPLDQTASYIGTVTTPVNASNTTGNTTFTALVAPANDLIGSCYQIKAYGLANGEIGSTLTYWVAINGIPIISIPITFANDFSVSPILWNLEALVTLGGSGALASVLVDGELLWNVNVNSSHASGQTTVNQAAQWTISCGATMGSANPINSITCRQGIIRRN
jgi:hypothetical protein